MFSPQIEDLSQQASMAAAEKFKAPEPAAPMGGDAAANTPAIAEESEEEEVGISHSNNIYPRTQKICTFKQYIFKEIVGK